MNRSVIIDNCNLRDSFDLTMTSKSISSAEVKKETVDVPSANGVIDLSTALTGDAVYKNRVIKITLIKDDPEGKLLKFQSEFDSCFHGRMVELIFEEDPEYYWKGRVSIEHKIDRVIDQITLTLDALPYKYKLKETVIQERISASKKISCVNTRKWVTPAFETDSSMNIKFENKSYSIDSGKFILAGLVFKQGINELEVTGNGDLKITYLEGAL
ncbi:distal tail protein Dit [Thomasclavelia cocleata]|uniref:distal tail protein Dit n=1 Tax=Thomasclavelia cocleata TaxID=69824 RepID=UPI00256FBB79|nr:distal tail protein Dit [Thomasclavelia cocleata]